MQTLNGDEKNMSIIADRWIWLSFRERSIWTATTISEHVAHSNTRRDWRNLFSRTGENRTEHRKKEHIGG